jgi:hypothetical protein
MTKKKKKASTKCSKKKGCKKTCSNNCGREKTYGDPTPVRPVTGEIYPKIFFKESWWTKFKRFIGLG